MDIKELRKKSEAELQKILKSEREVMRDLRFRIAAKQHKDVRELRESKHSIAQVLTILKEKKFLARLQQKQSISDKIKQQTK